MPFSYVPPEKIESRCFPNEREQGCCSSSEEKIRKWDEMIEDDRDIGAYRLAKRTWRGRCRRSENNVEETRIMCRLCGDHFNWMQNDRKRSSGLKRLALDISLFQDRSFISNLFHRTTSLERLQILRPVALKNIFNLLLISKRIREQGSELYFGNGNSAALSIKLTRIKSAGRGALNVINLNPIPR